MKTIMVAAASLALLWASTAQAADAVGVWRTQTNGEVELFHCGADICGKLLNSPRLKTDPGLKDQRNKDQSLQNRPLKGMVFITGFKGGPASWTDGKLYNPEDGNTYAGSITVQADGTLQLKGCAAVVLCKTQVWTRIR
jgi:uncharacterized protein (DUF2147 family)